MRIAVFLLLILAAPSLVFCQTFSAPATLRGVVTDAADAAIAGAILTVHWDPAGSGIHSPTNVGITTDRIIRTGNDGSFAIELPPGFYDVFVSSTAFSPLCRKVRLLPSAGTNLTFRMLVDPLVLAELGEQIVTVIPNGR